MSEENAQVPENKTPEYIERMIIEHNDLAAKVRGLANFVEKDEAKNLGRARYNLLVEQEKAMQQYLEVLVTRLEIECMISGVELTANDNSGEGEGEEA